MLPKKWPPVDQHLEKCAIFIPASGDMGCLVNSCIKVLQRSTRIPLARALPADLNPGADEMVLKQIRNCVFDYLLFICISRMRMG